MAILVVADLGLLQKKSAAVSHFSMHSTSTYTSAALDVTLSTCICTMDNCSLFIFCRAKQWFMNILSDSSISKSTNQIPIVFHVKWKGSCMVALICISYIECEVEHLFICSNYCLFNENYLLCHWPLPSCINKFGILTLSLWQNRRKDFFVSLLNLRGHKVVF